MSASLVGSEMCIRDRGSQDLRTIRREDSAAHQVVVALEGSEASPSRCACLLYTSDAADDM
eukprot:9525156-Alexandrium_andersonii.AAC.1